MGGWNSGRHGGTDCTDDCRSIDIRRWQRDGLLITGRSFNWQWTQNGETEANIGVTAEDGRVMLSYRYRRNEGEWQNLDYPAKLAITPCTYGGVRYWFTCPAVGCGRRVALLYLGDKYFACRHCYQLAYESQREPDILNGDGGRPKGMHWRTFERLTEEHEQFVGKSLASGLSRFGIIF
jgi:hypothetical protein